MELKKACEYAKKAIIGKQVNRIIFLLGLGGIVLIYLSSLFTSGHPTEEPDRLDNTVQEASTAATQQQLEEDLQRVVKAVTGEPSPVVMVTLENSGRTFYAEDKKSNRQESGREEESTYVILEDKEGAQQGLSLNREQPKVKGVVIVSKAATNPVVREKLVNAARTALGVSSTRVCVVEGG
ncbi:hypothetical protein [Acutalibacter caecimuris]|uniref:hypothetical protein n=1 Tax=Acutalibacter caecimuris TaxID=3093657 RepID=UPI002AC8A905|nr:hypothetical protein [Acutalibacter sp. M00118]